MNILCCRYKCSCAAVAVAVSLIVGVIAAFLQITGVFVLTPVILGIAAAVAAVYLGTLVLVTLLAGRRDRGRDCCAVLRALLTGLLGSILLAAVLAVMYLPWELCRILRKNK